MLDEGCALIRAAVLGHDWVVHDLEGNAINEVVRDLALLLVLGVADGEGGAEIIPLLLEVGLALRLLFLSVASVDVAGFHARVDVVCVSLELCFEHGLEVGQDIAPPPDALALADVPLGLLALEHQGGDGGSIRCLLGRRRAQLVGHEGAGQGFVRVVDAELGLRWARVSRRVRMHVSMGACRAYPDRRRPSCCP